MVVRCRNKGLGSKWVYHGLKYSKQPLMVPILGTLVHGGIPHTFYVGFSRLVVCFMVIPWWGGAKTRVLINFRVKWGLPWPKI